MFYLLLDSIVNDTEAEINEDLRLVNRARELLCKSENASVLDIAKECAVSESGLRRVFKEVMGITPIQYRIKARLQQAKYLLESTDLSIGEIAEKLNFFDSAYFARCFARISG